MATVYVYGIVEQHQGWVRVESQVGVGTAFHVWMPHVAAAHDTDRALASLAPEAGRSEAILLVEDEISVRRLVGRVLVANGYRVFEAGSGPEALRVFDANQNDIDLLLTDPVMPGGMSGLELGATCQAAKPSLKVIYSSGYAEATAGGRPALRDAGALLEKPHNPERLLRKVREVLDAR